MKKQVLGFMSLAQYVENTPGYDSKIGELSTWSSTFSTSKGEYADSFYPGYLLTTFSVIDAATAVDTFLTPVEAGLYLKIAQASVTYAVNNSQPLDPNDFRDYIQAEFFDEIENLVFGELVVSTRITMPAWISYNQKKGDKNIVRIWFADENFAAEYPDYDLTIVPPYPDLMIFTGGWQVAVNKLAEWNNMRLIDEVQAKKDLNPETYLRGFEFDFVNRINPTQKIPTTWYVLVYGEAGDDEDVIKDAIIDKLVKETGKDEAFWEKVFPELFKRTEFVLYPRWDKISVPNLSDLTALYSPFASLKDTQAYVADKAQFYPAAHVSENIFTLPVTYKSINVAGVNGVNNADAQKTIQLAWPDYIAVGTESPDFGRMQPLTQEWVHLLIKLVATAEVATTTSTLPSGIRRRQRNGLTYLSGRIAKSSYLVCMRRNFI